MTEFRACAVIPTYDNPDTIGSVVDRVRSHGLQVIVVDDGSATQTRQIVAGLGESGQAQVIHRPVNGGKGAAVRTGLDAAYATGFTHALQIDADGQHEMDDVPRFLLEAERNPQALVLGRPLFDASVPRGRLWARQITRFWTTLETLGPVIDDPMCGFRVYPLAAAVAVANRCGPRMDFDIEIAVRLAWLGVPVRNLPTQVRYPPGGVSHFRYVRDNLAVSWLHTRLVLEGWLVQPWRVLARRIRSRP